MTIRTKKGKLILPLQPTKPTKHTEPQWNRFMGNNHDSLSAPGYSFGGGVSFASHIGKPLTEKLWTDLVFRLGVRAMRIYKPHEAEWTNGHGAGDAIIRLDKKNNVRDIEYWR